MFQCIRGSALEEQGVLGEMYEIEEFLRACVREHLRNFGYIPVDVRYIEAMDVRSSVTRSSLMIEAYNSNLQST